MAGDEKHEVKAEHLLEALDMVIWDAEQSSGSEDDED